MLESQAEEQKEISVEQKLQVSIPLPENSKYLVKKQLFLVKEVSFQEYYTYNMMKLQMIL